MTATQPSLGQLLWEAGRAHFQARTPPWVWEVLPEGEKARFEKTATRFAQIVRQRDAEPTPGERAYTLWTMLTWDNRCNPTLPWRQLTTRDHANWERIATPGAAVDADPLAVPSSPPHSTDGDLTGNRQWPTAMIATSVCASCGQDIPPHAPCWLEVVHTDDGPAAGTSTITRIICVDCNARARGAPSTDNEGCP